MDFLTALAVGIGLAAASGMRVFVPVLFLAVGTKMGSITPGEHWAWIGSWGAIAGLAVAAAIEITAYYVPILDNLLDTVATPAAAIGGAFVAAVPIMSALDQTHPGLGLLTSAIVGGGTATAVQAVTVTARAASTATTAGAGNPIVASLENTGATVLSFVTLVLPFAIGLVLLTAAGWLTWRWVRPRPVPAE